MGAPLRVLVVDDNAPVRSLLAKALRNHGCVVYEAESGPNALRVAFEIRPALAIVDQWMPEMTGAELIRIIRAAPNAEVRSMAIIGLSGRPGSERELLRAGAATFLRKPFGDAELRAALEAALREVPGPGSPAA